MLAVVLVSPRCHERRAEYAAGWNVTRVELAIVRGDGVNVLAAVHPHHRRSLLDRGIEALERDLKRVNERPTSDR